MIFDNLFAKILLSKFIKVEIMANVANCKKCGTLFLQTSKRDICDKCFEAQNKMLSEINTFVITSPEETIPIEVILQKFNLTKDEFESFYLAGKFVKIGHKVTFVCSKCGKTVPIANKTNFICNSCAKKLQNEI